MFGLGACGQGRGMFVGEAVRGQTALVAPRLVCVTVGVKDGGGLGLPVGLVCPHQLSDPKVV
jgi:hypothetical protein